VPQDFLRNPWLNLSEQDFLLFFWKIVRTAVLFTTTLLPFLPFQNPPVCCTLKRKHFGTAQQHMYILSEITEQKPQILMKPGFNAKWICYFGCQQKCRIVLVVSKTIYQQSCMTFVVSNTPLANLKTVCF